MAEASEEQSTTGPAGKMADGSLYYHVEKQGLVKAIPSGSDKYFYYSVVAAFTSRTT